MIGGIIINLDHENVRSQLEMLLNVSEINTDSLLVTKLSKVIDGVNSRDEDTVKPRGYDLVNSALME
jgi:hypothetical protein